MNTSTQNILAGSSLRRFTGQESRNRTAARTTTPTEFQRVLQSSASTPASPSKTPAPVTAAAVNTSDAVAHLGPFTVGAISKPAQQTIPDPAPLPTAPYTPLPATQQALLNQDWNPFNQAQHEAKMNQWYIETTQASNQQSLSLYQHAVADWKENAAHCQDLGIAGPPPPVVPVLQAVGPMPDGYWFGKNSQG